MRVAMIAVGMLMMAVMERLAPLMARLVVAVIMDGVVTATRARLVVVVVIVRLVVAAVIVRSEAVVARVAAAASTRPEAEAKARMKVATRESLTAAPSGEAVVTPTVATVTEEAMVRVAKARVMAAAGTAAAERVG